MRVQDIQILIVLGALMTPAMVTADSPCNPHLEPYRQSDESYRDRGDNRCEGVYIEKTAGSPTLFVASFARRFADYDLKRVQELELSWRSPGPIPPHFQVVAIDDHIYRMDAYPKTGSIYRWPTSVLKRLDLTRDKLGITCTISRTVDGKVRPLYLPVEVRPKEATNSATNSPKSYELLIMPGTDLSEIYVTWGAEGADGAQAKAIRIKKLTTEPYAAGTAVSVEIPVSDLVAKGYYWVTIAARNLEKKASTVSFTFYHADGD